MEGEHESNVNAGDGKETKRQETKSYTNYSKGVLSGTVMMIVALVIVGGLIVNFVPVVIEFLAGFAVVFILIGFYLFLRHS